MFNDVNVNQLIHVLLIVGMAIKCGNCKNHHDSVTEVKSCYKENGHKARAYSQKPKPSNKKGERGGGNLKDLMIGLLPRLHVGLDCQIDPTTMMAKNANGVRVRSGNAAVSSQNT